MLKLYLFHQYKKMLLRSIAVEQELAAGALVVYLQSSLAMNNLL